MEAVDEANRRPDGWGQLAKFEDLGPLVAQAARRSAEPKVTELQELASQHGVIALALAELRAKGYRSYNRQKGVIGLVEAARRCVDRPAITETLAYLDVIATVYGEQADSHAQLVSRVEYATPAGIEAVDAAWDASIRVMSTQLTRMIRETTAVPLAS